MPDEPLRVPSNGYDTLVLSGGSAKGVVTLGAIQYLYDNFLLRDVTHYIGTSSGALISYLLIIGYTPVEIIVYICTHQLMERMQHFNIIAMIQGRGAASFSIIQQQLERMTIEKIGYLPTLEELKTHYGKTLTCVTHNFTKNCAEYISPMTHPNIPCVTALHMSANLPLVFETFEYNGSSYIDGGISDNFAIDVAETVGSRVLGISLSNEPHPSDIQDIRSMDETTSMLEYVYKLIFIPIQQSTAYKIRQARDNTHVIQLCHTKLKFFNFNLDSKGKLEMFSDGYSQTRQWMDNSS